MAIKVGIVYDVDENWIAGSYYVENLISALRTVSGDKPVLKIYSRKQSEFDNLQRTTGYPHLIWVPLVDRNTLFDRIANKLSRFFIGRNLITRGIDSDVDVLFPASNTYFFDNIKTKLFWIPDFQEAHLPQFFTQSEIENRRKFLTEIVRSESPVIISSEHAKSDFLRLHPKSNNKAFVLPFAVTLPTLDNTTIEKLKEGYGINRDYFICSNQFWAHKNHRVVLDAIINCKGNDNLLVVFTGKPFDRRNPGYYDELMRYVQENDLVSKTLFLGFIKREDQLILMKNSIAVIQPSLFEGWSTVVEDAKALGKRIIASDIEVHREQLGVNYQYFFEAKDSAALSEILEKVAFESTTHHLNWNYDKEVPVFGEKFINIIRQVL